MSPTIVAKDGELFMVTGSPGGRTIISTVAGVLFARIFLGLPPERAVWGPRLHHQWFPDRISLEEGVWPAKTIAALEGFGHTVERIKSQGAANSILWDEDRGYVGVGDFRRDGWAAAPIWFEGDHPQ